MNSGMHRSVVPESTDVMKKTIFISIFSAMIFTGCSQTKNVNYRGRTASDLLQLKGNIKSVKEYVYSISNDSNKLENILPIPIPREWIFHTNSTIEYQNSLNYKDLNEIIVHKLIKQEENKEYWYEIKGNDTILIEEITLNDSCKIIHSKSYNYSKKVTSKMDIKYSDKKIESVLLNEFSKDKSKTITYLNSSNQIDSFQVFSNGKLINTVENKYTNNYLSQSIYKYTNGQKKEITYKYKYDDTSNWVEKIMYEDGVPTLKTIRDIIYH